MDTAKEARLRLMVALWAYAYEVKSYSMVSDHEYDDAARSIDPSVKTGVHDAFWKSVFSPETGSWVWQYPDQKKLEQLFDDYMKNYKDA